MTNFKISIFTLIFSYQVVSVSFKNLSLSSVGAVELDNLPLKKDALKSLGLPLEVKSGKFIYF